MAFEEDTESFEHTLLMVREVNVYKIPLRASSGGYKCAEWLVSDKIWSGRLRVVSQGEKCEIRLEDAQSGELFAACQVIPGRRETTVENAVDSSRYFVLRVDDGRGKHAYLGLGFAERNDAFDFNVALSDHEKHVLMENQKAEERRVAAAEGNENVEPAKPALDLRLKKDEKIRISVKTSNPSVLKKPAQVHPGGKVPLVVMPSVGGMKGSLAPPPGGGRIRQPLPPPKEDNGSARSAAAGAPGMAGVQKLNDSFFSMGALESSLPSSTKPPANGVASAPTAGAGWAAF
eukprot:TRINITY_DN14334_c0_g1_i1.p1 TRINITY_DN14334_c0_g1~~TRINITY_DN14334_c0_g1_i1.p1  ORF type:complete len:289 (+),score=55.67 TRINITY_DN14334_c0_g1_i1:521-1387(+)